MIIDANGKLSSWPFRRLIGDETADLVARLRKRNVTQAWVGSFDGIFHKDLSTVNSRLVEDCRTHGQSILLPLDPSIPSFRTGRKTCGAAGKSIECLGFACIPTTMGTSLRTLPLPSY